MKKLFLISVLCVGLLVFAGVAGATVFTLDSYEVTLIEEDPGLVLWETDILGTPVSQDFQVGQSTGWFNLFYIGTSENYVNADDILAKDIEVSFAFSAPATFGGSLSGYTRGRFFYQDGIVRWDDPDSVQLMFGDGGLFEIALSEVSFDTPGSAIVRANMTLISDSAPVPEPTTLLLSGLGLLGMGAYIRRKRSKK